MQSKTINAVLTKKLNDWLDSIPVSETAVRKAIKEETIITGGAIVSLLQNETPNDFDVYFRTLDAVKIVGKYYTNWFNSKLGTTNKQVELQEVILQTAHCKGYKPTSRYNYEWVIYDPSKRPEQLEWTTERRVRVFVRSTGVIDEFGGVPKDIDIPEETEQSLDLIKQNDAMAEEPDRYRPTFMSSNAITLSNKIQIVLRFYGEPEIIHENYDFVHCTNYWTSWNSKVTLHTRALEAIMNKELLYVGSKYPLCSIIRTRKFIKRGWNINAGQILKMVLQLHELDLLNPNVFEEQLTGVDSTYFNMAIEWMKKKCEEDESFKPTVPYMIEIINSIF